MPLPLAEFQHAGIRVLATSVGGEETFAILPEYNLAFDVGRAPREMISIDHVFLTHGHMDHAAGVAYYFSQRMFVDLAPGNLYLPEPLLEPVRQLLRLWGEIDGQVPPANLHVARPLEDVQLRRDLVVRPFRVNHPARRHAPQPVDSLGFAAIEVRRKLKPEFADLSGPQLVELKKKGVEITRRLEVPLVAYCGDTAPGAFLELDCVRKARILMLECTFVQPDHLARARAGYHLHLSQLRELLPKLENERILLMHLSRRTLAPEARKLLRQELGSEFGSRIMLLMDARRRRRSAGPPANDAARQ